MSDTRSLRQPDRTANDVARQLRDDFARGMREVTGTDAPPDVALRVLFHAVAAQVDWVYREADQVFFDAALDDLMRGLGMPPRVARPAQAVVQFSQLQVRGVVSPETQLTGYQPNGAQMLFVPDATLDVAPVDLVFCGVAENGRLTAVPGATLPGGGRISAGTSTPLDSARTAPAILMAFASDESHLSRLGLYVEPAVPNSALPATLARSPWQLLNADGLVSERGLLRSTTTRGGMRRLTWPGERGPGHQEESAVAQAVPVSGGLYGGAVWLFPEVGPERRWRSRVPPSIATAVPRLLPDGQERALDRPLVWLQIPLPAGTRDVVGQIARVAVNCVTASNIEAWNDQVDFSRMGTVVMHRPFGVADRHLMGVLSVTGETGVRYGEISDLEAPPGAGRYRHRADGRFEIAPARHDSGRFDAYAMLRLLYSDGEQGNGIPAGEIKQIRSELSGNPTARVLSLTPTRGGAQPPAYAPARQRFAELLRTRERLVTAGDIEVAARAVDDRVRDVRVDSRSEITESGLGLITQVAVAVQPEEFADPEAELERLRAELEGYLGERCMMGQKIRVTVERARK